MTTFAGAVTVAQFTCFIIGETTLAIRCAELLCVRGHHLHGIVSDNPDVVRWAAENAVRVIDPSHDFAGALLATPHDYLFSIVNERVLPPAVIAAPRCLAVNYHDAPLPRYAGMHATSWALMNRETVHGVTWHVVNVRIDAGDIVWQRTVPVDPADTALSLNAKCYVTAADAFAEMIDALARGDVTLEPQDLARRTYFGRYRRPPAAAILDWRRPVAELSALVRALDLGHYPNRLGRPKLILADGSVLACHTLESTGSVSGAEPGTVLGLGPDWLMVAAVDGDAKAGGLSTLAGDVLRPDALAAEFGVRVGLTLPLPSDELSARVSAADAAAARVDDFWLKRLSNPRPIPAPFAREWPIRGEPRWHELSMAVPGAFRDLAADEIGRDCGSLVVAAVAVYLSRISGERELDVAVRLPEIRNDGVERVFATVVPLRIRMDPSLPFRDISETVARELECVRHRGTYARDLIGRHPQLRGRDGAPRYPVQMHLASRPDLSVVDPSDVADLHITLDAAGETCTFTYRDGALAPGDAARVADQLETLMLGIVASPDRSVARLPLVPAAERTRLLADWNQTTAEYPRHLTVHALFEAQVARTPTAVAVTDAHAPLTYQELDARAEAVAARLRALGAAHGALVGVCMGRSPALVVALLGVLKSGAAYVPLDIDYPEARQRFIVEDAALRIFVVEDTVPPPPVPPDASVVVVNGAGDIVGENARAAAGELPEHRPARLEDLAYVIYTSGSTGTPKGVMIPHRAVVNYLTWAAAAYDAAAGAGAPLHSSPAFDLTITALYVPLISGTAVHVADQRLGVEALTAALRARPGFSLVKLTPAHLALLAQQLTPAEVPGATRAFVVGGENLHGESLEFWRRHAPSTALFNEYGPTETVVGCCVYRVQPADHFSGSVPIGRPIANTRLYVLDANRELLPAGLSGELYIGGDGVGAGYLNRPELTAERFLADPFAGVAGARMYRTGDLVRYRADGNLEFLGRLDDQVKVRGFRIELGEIEAVLDTLPGVRSAAAAVREFGPGDPRLVAYYVPVAGSEPDESALRAGLRHRLPDYMVPSALVRLDAMPLTENGKVDRKALPKPEVGAPRRPPDAQAPRGVLEQAIAAVWQETLAVAVVGRSDDFFELGGHSLLMQRVRALIRERTGHELSTMEMFRNPTVAGLASVIGSRVGAGPVAGHEDRANGRHDSRSEAVRVARRFLVPRFAVSLYYYARFGAKVSPHAEVELSPLLTFGKGCVVGSFTKIKAADGPVQFGHRCGVATSCFITGGERGIYIGDNFGCGPNVSIVSSSFVWDRTGMAPSDQGRVSAGIRIGNNVWLGANVTVLDGAELGDDTIVVAGSVVEGRHPPGVILRGNPAQVVGHR